MADGNRYPARSIALHWITVLFIILAVGLGASLANPPENWGDTLYRLHWSFGASILLLTLLRFSNRIVGGAPAPYAGLTPLEKTASNVVHKALYALLIIVPVLGWLGKSAYGGDITIFGMFNLPPLVGQDEALAKRLLGAHKIVVKLLLAVIFLHVAGALSHVLIKRDGVMARMLPGRDKR